VRDGARESGGEGDFSGTILQWLAFSVVRRTGHGAWLNGWGGKEGNLGGRRGREWGE